MNRGGWFVIGVAAGAATGLLLAPQSGRRTRAMLRDKTVKYSHDVSDFSTKKSRHVVNKFHGYAHNVREAVASKMSRKETVPLSEEVVSA